MEPGKLPLLLCLGAFVVTFILTRVITRMIRAGIGPFKNNVSESGLHIHHAVPGILLLILGAIMAIRGPDSPWIEIAGVIIGIGTSLILDEFALILHLEDVYWSDEGRISVELAGLTAACIGFTMLGFSPVGVDDLTAGELQVRITLITSLIIQAHPHPDLPAQGQVPGGPDQLFRAVRGLVRGDSTGPAEFQVGEAPLPRQEGGPGDRPGHEVRPALGSRSGAGSATSSPARPRSPTHRTFWPPRRTLACAPSSRSRSMSARGRRREAARAIGTALSRLTV